MAIKNLADSARAATRAFRTFDTGKPELIPTGIPPVDAVIGGMGVGSAFILGGRTKMRKSTMVLRAAITNGRNGYPTGICSVEDPEDVIGSRLLAEFSGIDSLRIRRKDLLPGEPEKLREAIGRMEDVFDDVLIDYRVAARPEEAAESVKDLAARGCKLVWVDYIQKMRGSGMDRRNEVSSCFAALQRAAVDAKVALGVVSQIKRRPNVSDFDPPTIGDLKESGDLENEARLILLLHPQETTGHVVCRVAACTYGGEGLQVVLRRAENGQLEEVSDGFDV